MKPILTRILFVLAGLLLSLALHYKISNMELPVVPEIIPVPKDLDSEFVNQLYGICGAKLSEARTKLLTQQLLDVTGKYFTDLRDKQAFLYLICIESKFSASVKSHAGAVGYTQILPKYAQSFADTCGLGKLDAGDVVDPAVNLNLGACQFSTLLKKFSGNVALALAGYNSGADSSTTKKLSNLGEGSPETSGYLAKYLVLEQKVRGVK